MTKPCFFFFSFSCWREGAHQRHRERSHPGQQGPRRVLHCRRHLQVRGARRHQGHQLRGLGQEGGRRGRGGRSRKEGIIMSINHIVNHRSLHPSFFMEKQTFIFWLKKFDQNVRGLKHFCLDSYMLANLVTFTSVLYLGVIDAD